MGRDEYACPVCKAPAVIQQRWTEKRPMPGVGVVPVERVILKCWNFHWLAFDACEGDLLLVPKPVDEDTPDHT